MISLKAAKLLARIAANIAKLPELDRFAYEARRIAANIAKLPELLNR